MTYFIVLRMPLNYATDYDLTDLDDIMQLRMFMRFESQQMALVGGGDTANYDKWLSMHSNGYFPVDKNYDVLVKDGLTIGGGVDEVQECKDKLYEVSASPAEWCISDETETYHRFKSHDRQVDGDDYYAWQGIYNTVYTMSATPSADDKIYVLNLDGDMDELSTVSELGKAFDEISTFTTELATFTKITIK